MNKKNDGRPGHVRIIGGRLRGSRLTVPVVRGLRPTPQRLRQTLFDWLAPVIAGARVLDAFAGTGALGIEALSRGAASATFFERDPEQARAVQSDLARLHQAGEVRRTDTLEALARAAPAPFDIAFVDPPFDASAWQHTAALLDANGWLADQAWVYVESGRDDVWTPPARWEIHRQRDAGAVRGKLFRVGAPET
ncbi:MAG TPA: 16S rRNA (guanine(966)-N(2))-methyltransferase RsmD [Rhodanobacteraceae bacterium]|nr:16S rRNA (guanine(966)-N(2))-methyltransferase RsmD [Rhodanobacteraceae bacterium]